MQTHTRTHTHAHTHLAHTHWAHPQLLMRVYAVVLAQVMDGRTIGARLFLLLSLPLSLPRSFSVSLSRGPETVRKI